jgi:hypothetical protein
MNSTLRESLEAWEQEIAAYWDAVIRSPDFLSRIGYQLTQTLLTQQRIAASFRAAVSPPDAQVLVVLDRLEQQVSALNARIDALEHHLDHE